MGKDLYTILGIPPNAPQRDIRAAYRMLAKKYHPDTGAGSSEEKFREIQNAYQILADPVKRAAYDRKRGRRAPASAPSGSSWFSTRAEFSQRMAPSHLDLRDIFARRPSEPVGRRRAAEAHGQQASPDPWDELEEFLRIFDDVDRLDKI